MDFLQEELIKTRKLNFAFFSLEPARKEPPKAESSLSERISHGHWEEQKSRPNSERKAKGKQYKINYTKAHGAQSLMERIVNDS